MFRKVKTTSKESRLPSRRDSLMAAAAVVQHGLAQTAPIPIIDTHIHFFDTTRPQGVPYGERNPVGPIASPAIFRKIAAGLGVVGAIEVEASPWIEDNLWVLEISQTDPMMVGFIGNLEPGKPEFREYLDRYRRNPLFRGIRYGNLWGRILSAELAKPEFIAGIRELAAADLILDTANPDADLIQACVRLTDRVPELRLMIDHLPGMTFPEPSTSRTSVESNLRELAKRNVFVKGSAIPRRVSGQIQTNPAVYKPRLDFIWDTFGEDRIVFGSDWPNSTGNWVSYEQTLAIVRQYLETKSRGVAEKYFWKNSIVAYKWIKRDPSQPH